jgi:hypothetical protein
MLKATNKYGLLVFTGLLVAFFLPSEASADVVLRDSVYMENTSTPTMPSHETGDLVVAIVKSSTPTQLTTPPSSLGWVKVHRQTTSGTGDGVAAIYYRYTTSNSDSMGTWSDYPVISTFVFYSDTEKVLAIGAYTVHSSNVASNITARLPELTTLNATTSSYILRAMYGHYASYLNYCNAPSGFTILDCLDTNPPRHFSFSSSSAPSTNFPEYNFGGSTGQGWFGASLQIFEVPYAKIPLLNIDDTMPPYKFATSSCETSGDTSLCVYAYRPEIYYHDWMIVMAFMLFLLSFPVVGFYLSRTHKK